MPKSYINNAVVGNSGMLACIDDKGELIRLYWPDIDYPQHIDRFKAGIFFPDGERGTSWLDSGEWRSVQRYIPETNILETVYECTGVGLGVCQTDFVLPDRAVLVRHYEFENSGDYDLETGFIVYSSCISTNPQLACILFDHESDLLIHYRHDYYISVSADAAVLQFQLGNDAFQSAGNARLKGNDSIGMTPDGAVSWRLGILKPGAGKSFNVFICASHTLDGVKDLAGESVNFNYTYEYKKTVLFWSGCLKSAVYEETGNGDIDGLYRRSVLLFKLMADEKSGGLLATPEVDEEFTKCGRYAYCWVRDAAFITGALDRCGFTGTVDRFYRWAVKTQDKKGFWHQRYHMDGNLAPSWGLQADETGTLVWGALKHYEIVKDRAFLSDMWDCVRKAVIFLSGYIDGETGLPWLSYDIWEERPGEHAYTAAAVYAGIMAGAEIGGILGKPSVLLDEWRRCACSVRTAVEKYLYKPEWGRFIRGVRVKMNPWGEECGKDKILLKLDSKGNCRDFTLEDRTVDVSLLGLSVPFGLFDAQDGRMKRTAEIVETVLASSPSGGLKRYENDGYIGGNPWVIATLWAALYRIEIKDYERAVQYFEWAVRARTGLGLLPEQVDRNTGKPVWVIPLTWSHAMFVLVRSRLMEAGILRRNMP